MFARIPVMLASLCLLAALPVSAQTLERGNGPEPSTLDAHRCPEVSCGNILRDLYEGLVAEDGAGRLIPGMAERWEVSPDGRTWTFHLRAGLRWSNGERLGASDIVASFRRAFEPLTAAPFAVHFDALENANAVQSGKLPSARLGVFAPDARTVVFRLTRSAALPQMLLLPIAYPVYLPAIRAHGAQHTRAGHLVVNGAYRLAAWTPQAHVLLEANPNYRELPPIRRVRFQVTEDAASELQRYQAGGLHITETLPPLPLANLRERFGGQVRISPYLGAMWIGLNLTQPPLRDNPALREALSLAIDRDILTRYITGLGEMPAYGLVPPGVADYSPASQPWAAATQKQRNVLAQRRYREAGYGPANPLRIELRYNTSTPLRRMNLAIAAMWRETLGAQVVLRNEEWKVFVGNRKQRIITQAFRGGWIADLNDARNFLANFQAGSATNWSGLADPTFDRLLLQADAAPTTAQRSALLKQAEARLLAQQAIVPIYYYTSKHLVRPEVIGFEANALDHHPSRFLRLKAP
ncbi:peptide ABC transporter substrate-binding protein [Arenimonas sp.]|uniref:peptide ABC transporter substrate-binding protein n=1 Tax=Arenimonas sp. TaxID=1872635 RepID=UPI0039E60470